MSVLIDTTARPMPSPVKHLSWIIIALLAALAATVALFERQQATHRPPVFGNEHESR